MFLYSGLAVGLLVVNLGGQSDMWAAIASIFTQSFNLCTCIYCPYVILKKLKQSSLQRSKEQAVKQSQIGLKKILSRKGYFFAFLEHLVHELSVEVWLNCMLVLICIHIFTLSVLMFLSTHRL